MKHKPEVEQTKSKPRVVTALKKQERHLPSPAQEKGQEQDKESQTEANCSVRELQKLWDINPKASAFCARDEKALDALGRWLKN